MHTNDEYFWDFLNLENKNIGLYHLNRSFTNGDRIDLGREESLRNITKYHERDAVILMSHEAQLTLSIIENLPNNIFCFDCIGNIDHKRYCVYFYWFGSLQAKEKTGPSACNLVDNATKSTRYMFDCLLGRVRLHREFVYNNINSSSFKDCVLLSYFGRTKSWLPGDNIDSDPGLKGGKNSVDDSFMPIDISNIDTSQLWVPYGLSNSTCMMSQLLPWRIYNNSWYSIITETFPTKAYHSEKTAKALLGGRIFVVFSGCGALRTLRQAGFQTFGDIIDESYDDIEDDNLRFAMAWRQVEALAQTDPYEIYKKFGHITQHNQQHFMNTDWDDQFRQNVYRLLNI